jgi:hypothetical protein
MTFPHKKTTLLRSIIRAETLAQAEEFVNCFPLCGKMGAKCSFFFRFSWPPTPWDQNTGCPIRHGRNTRGQINIARLVRELQQKAKVQNIHCKSTTKLRNVGNSFFIKHLVRAVTLVMCIQKIFCMADIWIFLSLCISSNSLLNKRERSLFWHPQQQHRLTMERHKGMRRSWISGEALKLLSEPF